MKLKKIYQILDTISPFMLQEKWDNSGLQLGDLEAEIKNIYLCIDIDAELIDSLPPHSLIITHHPLIFGKLTSLEYNHYPAKLLVKMIKKDIAHIAMHTNFDKTHLNNYVARNVLGVDVECEEFICYFEKEMYFDEALEWVSKAFGLACPRYVKAKDTIKRIALTTGSGGSLIDEVEADLFLTGDLKYHEAMKAQEMGLSIIDIGHYESERYFAQALAEQLKKEPIQAIIATIKNPLKVKDERIY
ncbi:Nif3-like dinuclear metal center hexameric protein [Nitratiruptor sp. YY09-18]|uniref:Nif3-like dinuclear metal center hexameric protein n=1 Tax=Nitratiruptor sp. YY09-18 TaxID=2724901 RepID=UPI0019160DEE|nr:Nif3-like dinuclear metal center hexameric protein [Nitratiruptor sp. YY09-18]BCD68610.1 GTP cyclohydrolase I [Nitratiruptor sp. YY09-18]